MARGDEIGAHEIDNGGSGCEAFRGIRWNDQFQHGIRPAQQATVPCGERGQSTGSRDFGAQLTGKRCARREQCAPGLDLQPVLVADDYGGAVDDRDTHGFHPQILAPASLCDAICSLVCRVSTSWREGLIGCAQSQSLFSRGSVAHPAIETAIKSRVAVSLYVMPDLS